MSLSFTFPFVKNVRLRTLFFAAAAAFTTVSSVAPVSAQDEFSASEVVRPRRVTQTAQVGGNSRLENDLVIVSRAAEEESITPMSAAKPSEMKQRAPFVADSHSDQLLLAAIDLRIGTPYVFGASGPSAYDCSGFVWSVFQSAGTLFERSTARSLWAQFPTAGNEERFRFGTLVFFNNLQHVGIVADEQGFYHASRSRGVVYSSFDDYWTPRIDGFRRVATGTRTLAAR